MNFKKHGKVIFGVVLNSSEQKALETEIRKQVVEKSRRLDMEIESVMLYVLHKELGLGPKKLKQIWESLYTDIQALRKHYQMNPEDDGYLARRSLRSIGVDVEQWYKENNLDNLGGMNDDPR